MKTIIDKANTRGYFNHGWLKTAQFENLGELVKNTIFVA